MLTWFITYSLLFPHHCCCVFQILQDSYSTTEIENVIPGSSTISVCNPRVAIDVGSRTNTHTDPSMRGDKFELSTHSWDHGIHYTNPLLITRTPTVKISTIFRHTDRWVWKLPTGTIILSLTCSPLCVINCIIVSKLHCFEERNTEFVTKIIKICAALVFLVEDFL
jgi:hypothetical protein